MDDNIYPNNGADFAHIPSAQSQEHDQEANEVIVSAPVIVKAIDRLRDHANNILSMDSVPSEVLTDPVQFMHVVAGNKKAAEVLLAEADYLETLHKEYVTEATES